VWNGYGVRSNLASSGEPSPLLHMTTLTTEGIPPVRSLAPAICNDFSSGRPSSLTWNDLRKNSTGSAKRKPKLIITGTCTRLKRGGCRAEQSKILVRRVDGVVQRLTSDVFQQSLRGLYPCDRMIFTLLLAVNTDLRASNVTEQEFVTFIKCTST